MHIFGYFILICCVCNTECGEDFLIIPDPDVDIDTLYRYYCIECGEMSNEAPSNEKLRIEKI